MRSFQSFLMWVASSLALLILSQTANAETFSVYNNRDISTGRDLGKFVVRTSRDCMEKCIAYSTCKAFVWVTARSGSPVTECFLKDSRTMGKPPAGVSCSAHLRR